MATTYKNAGVNLLTTTISGVYTAPGGTTALVKTLMASNSGRSGSAFVSLSWYDFSLNNQENCLINSGEVPTGTILQIIDGTLVLEAGDSISGKSNAVNTLNITAAIMELT